MNTQDIPSTGLSVAEKNVSGEGTLKQDEASREAGSAEALRTAGNALLTS